MSTKVVNKKHHDYDVYIGRMSGEHHWGNPFSHQISQFDTITVGSRAEAVTKFTEWLDGKHPTVKPHRREWILRNIHTLKGQTLGCFCKTLNGKIDVPCHGDELARRAELT